MATTIRELLAKIGVKVEGQKALDRVDKSFDRLKTRVRKLTVFLAGATAALAGFVGTSVAAGNAAAKAADRVGVGVERYQELAFAAGQADADVRALEGALRFANRQLGEAAGGSEEARKRFQAFGLGIRDANGQLKTSDQILEEAADQIAAIRDPALQSARAGRLFGEEYGPRLVPLLRQGSAGIALLTARARELGLVIGEDQARRSEAFLDRLDDLFALGKGLRNVFTGAALPALTRFVEKLIEVGLRSREAVAARLEVWGERLGKVFSLLGRIVDRLSRGLEQLGISASGLDIAIRALQVVLGVLAVKAVITFAVALQSLYFAIPAIIVGVLSWVAANALLLAQIGLVVAALILLGIAVDDVLTYFRGGDSVIGEFFDAFGRGRVALMESTRDWLKAMGDDLRTVIDLFREGPSAIGGFFDSLTLRGARDAVSGFAGDVATETGLVLRSITSLGGLLGGQLAAVQSQAGAQLASAGAAPRVAAPAQNNTTITGAPVVNFSGVAPADQDAAARRVLAEQARNVRANLVEGADL